MSKKQEKIVFLVLMVAFVFIFVYLLLFFAFFFSAIYTSHTGKDTFLSKYMSDECRNCDKKSEIKNGSDECLDYYRKSDKKYFDRLKYHVPSSFKKTQDCPSYVRYFSQLHNDNMKCNFRVTYKGDYYKSGKDILEHEWDADIKETNINGYKWYISVNDTYSDNYSYRSYSYATVFKEKGYFFSYYIQYDLDDFGRREEILNDSICNAYYDEILSSIMFK